MANRTFNQKVEYNRYLIDGIPLGDVLGNDYDLLTLDMKRWLSDQTAVAAEVSIYRKGEGRITDEWTEPWMAIEGDYDEPFPTGTVEKTYSYSLRLTSFLLDHFFIDLTGGIERINNYRHITGEDRTRPYVNIRLSSFVWTGLSVD